MASSRLLLLPSVNAIRRVWTRSVTSAARPRFSFYPATKPRRIVMANVTKANFWETCEQLETHLKSAEFVALDFEMTGVETVPWRRHSELDTSETRYQHVKHSAESFAVWQCGICPFKWDDPGQKFVAYPYNFYIFPRNELPVEMAPRNYFCQTTSLEFLAKHNFDFNATVYNGISYLSMEQEEIARVKLGLTEEAKKVKKLTVESESEVPLSKTADVVFSERVRIQLGQWRDGLLRKKQLGKDMGVGESVGSSLSSRNTQPVTLEPPRTKASGDALDVKSEISGLQNSAESQVSGDKVFSNLRPAIFVDILGNNQARLVKQVIRKHFPDLVPRMITKHKTEDHKQMQVQIIYTTSKEDKARLMEELEEEKWRQLESALCKAVGFRRIIDAIKASGKPLVGHNCLLDLAHLHDKFLGPLPSNIREFSASIHRHFPCILDTKYLLKTEPTLRDANVNKTTSLAIVYQELCQGFPDKAGIPGKFYNAKIKVVGRPMSRVTLEIASELQRYSGGAETGLNHEAGFDAYMTGAVFAQLCHLLKVDVATIRSLPQAAVSREMGFASYANLLMLQTFRGQAALDLTTGLEAIGFKAPRGPASPPYRLPQRENVALLWGLLPGQTQEPALRRMVQNIFLRVKRQATVDIYSVDGSSALIEFRSSAVLEEFFQVLQVAVLASSSSTTTDAEDILSVKAARFEAYERICCSPLATKLLGMAADLLDLNQVQPIRACSNDSKYESATQASLGQSLSKSKGGVDDNKFSAFEVGHWQEPSSSLSEEDVIGRTDIDDVTADLQDRFEGDDIIAEQPTSSGVDHQNLSGTEGQGLSYRDNDEGPKDLAEDSGYSKWMKRAFSDDGSGSTRAANIVKLRSPKRPRVIGDNPSNNSS